MSRELIVVAALGIASAGAFAIDSNDVQQSIALKDGSTVYVLKDGNMAMEQAGRNRPVRLLNAQGRRRDFRP